MVLSACPLVRPVISSLAEAGAAGSTSELVATTATLRRRYSPRCRGQHLWLRNAHAIDWLGFSAIQPSGCILACGGWGCLWCARTRLRLPSLARSLGCLT